MAENRMKTFVSRVLWLDRVQQIRVLTFVAFLVIYEATAWSGLLYAGVVPSLELIASSMVRMLGSSSFYPHFGTTAFEAFCGFIIGTSLGIAIGLSFAFFRFVGDALYIWLLWLAPTPKIIFVPVLFLLFGIGMGSKVAMAALSAFFPVFVATFISARNVRQVLINVMKSFGASSWQTAHYVYLPSLVVPIIGSLRLGLGVAIIGTLLTEIKAAKAGLGLLLIESYNFFRIPDMYAILIIIFTFVMLANIAMDRLAARLSHP